MENARITLARIRRKRQRSDGVSSKLRKNMRYMGMHCAVADAFDIN
jgi:hypothetical protein